MLEGINGAVSLDVRDAGKKVKIDLNDLVELVASKVMDKLEQAGIDQTQNRDLEYGIELTDSTIRDLAGAQKTAAMSKHPALHKEAASRIQEARIKSRLASHLEDPDKADSVYADSMSHIAKIGKDLAEYTQTETVRKRGLLKKMWHRGKNGYDQDALIQKHADLVSSQLAIRKILKDHKVPTTLANEILEQVPKAARQIFDEIGSAL